MPSVILDAFGRPAQTGGGSGALYARSQDDARLRPPTSWHFDDYISLLSSGRWRSLVSESRAIGSKGIVAAAIAQKADYVSASDWRPYFCGEDAAYGEECEQLLEDTSALICTRGPRYDWRTFWRLGVMTGPLDGAFFINLTEGNDGWPLLQPLEAHRIGSRSNSAIVGKSSAFTEVKADDGSVDQIETPYVGLRIINGIIYNAAGAEIAYRVLGADGADDQDISARDMIHVGAPRWFSEGRPVPQISPAIMDLLGVDMARAAQLDQQIIHSKLTLKETNETGRRDPVKDLVNPPFTQPTAANTAPEVIERGHIRYIKNGSSLEAHKSDVPSSQWMAFDLRTLSTAMAAIGWRLEMLDPSDLGGAATRAFQDQINTQIRNTFQDYQHAVVRCTRYRIAKHIIRGDIPAHSEFLKWRITPPPDFVVDRNSAKIDVDMVRAGADNMPNVLRRSGLRARQNMIAQAKYEAMKDELARQYGVDNSRLGTTSIPGDADKITGISAAVKSGAITPSVELEASVRDYLNVPEMGPEALAAWKEAGVRTPISFAPQNGTAPIKASPEAITPPAEPAAP